MEVETDTKGYFKVSLPPGGYLVSPLAPDNFPDEVSQTGSQIQAEPLRQPEVQAVKVLPGQFTQVVLSIDTGERVL